MTIVGRLWRYCAALARELADESGYARHLKQTGRVHSAAEWKRFIDRRLARKYQNAKCC